MVDHLNEYTTKTTDYVIQQQERETQILNWAKENYKDYHDIQICAEKLNIRAGAVYTVLKTHNFIKHADTTEHRVMSAYFKHNGRLAAITEETGLTVWIVAKTIENLGYPPRWQEYRESRYVTGSGRGGIGAEEQFKRLVPDAVDMNEEFRDGYPDYDFIINNQTVDVKELSIIHPKGRGYEYFELKCYGETQPDFYCAFLCHDKENRLNGQYDILLIPTAVIPRNKKTIAINADKNTDSYQFWYQFQVDPNALAYMLGSNP
ncbi:hypothetical protein [Actinobacillus porcinus]|uniref:hypothetical protein n=1 Tax=Actinobacillus porcinus TaxID=51048 RepID=UPI002A9186F7|nr:hypothetical protein [Actinobacillus porcinus]MDY5847587.1 hypothetical protein [Actinobacillus porcinus]